MFFVICVCLCYTDWSVPCTLVITCWERVGLLALLILPCVVVTFPYGVLGQMWYLIVSIPDLCLLSYLSPPLTLFGHQIQTYLYWVLFARKMVFISGSRLVSIRSVIGYWPFQGGTSFVDLLCFCSVLCLLCFVRVCLYVLCGHLLGKGWPLGSRLWCLLWVCHFPIGILGQVWYLIVSIPDLCTITHF